MTRNQHYTRATELLAPLSERAAQGAPLSPEQRDRLEVAKVHSLLAGVPARVAGE